MFYFNEKLLENYDGFSSEEFHETSLFERTDIITLYSSKWYIFDKKIKFRCGIQEQDNNTYFKHSDSFLKAIEFLSKHYQPEEFI